MNAGLLPTLISLLLALLVSPALQADDVPRRDFRQFVTGDDAPLSVGQADWVGVVQPGERIALALQVSGVVAAVEALEGEMIAAGDVLILLEQEIEQLELERLRLRHQDRSALESAEQRLAMAEEQLETAEALFSEARTVSRDELRQLRLQTLVLRAERDGLRSEQERAALDLRIGEQRLAQRTLRAPISGVVSRITVGRGEWADAGGPIVELIDDRHGRLRFSVANVDAARLAMGDQLAFEVEGRRHSGEVDFISPLADPASGRVEVRIAFDNTDLRIRPGLAARVLPPAASVPDASGEPLR